MIEGPGPSPTIGRRQRVLQWAEAHRGPLTALTDALVWPLALTFSCWLRYEFSFSHVDGSDLALLAVFAAGVQVGLGRWQGLYTGRWRFGSFEEVANLVAAVAITTALVFVINLVPDPHLVPSGAVVISGLVALVTMGAVRYGWRLYLESLRRPDRELAQRTIVYGAGDAGHQLVRAMTSDRRSPLLPVAAVDDDPRKQQHRLARTRRRRRHRPGPGRGGSPPRAPGSSSWPYPAPPATSCAPSSPRASRRASTCGSSPRCGSWPRTRSG